MKAHLLLVQFGPFQRYNVVYDRFEAAGMREEVGRTTTGGERAPVISGDGRAIFAMSLAMMAVRKAMMHGWAEDARGLMSWGVERRLVEFGGI
jgi:hypothetical protein